MWTALLAILLAAVIVWVIVQGTTPASPKREAVMTAMNLEPASSYEQKTNHFPMQPVEMGPISGFETPFRVNAYNAYMS
jgi:hypothetical protein